MKILLVDLNHGKKSISKIFTPLALLKLSTIYKSRGDEVRLASCKRVPVGYIPDVICFSPIFIFNKKTDVGYIRGFSKKFPKALIRIGGISVSSIPAFFKKHLRDLNCEYTLGFDKDLDKTTPDFDLDDKEFCYGFTSRGCIRNCPWCLVPKMEGRLEKDLEWRRYLKNGRKLFVSMDNNILACGSGWLEEVLAEVQSRGMKIDFNQGLDCRVFVRDESIPPIMAKYKSAIDVTRFSWDSSKQDKYIHPTINIMAEYKIPPARWYVLNGFEDSLEEIFVRIKTLIDNKHFAKLMKFKDLETGTSPEGWVKDLNQFRDLIAPTGFFAPSNRMWFEDYPLFKKIVSLARAIKGGKHLSKGTLSPRDLPAFAKTLKNL